MRAWILLLGLIGVGGCKRGDPGYVGEEIGRCADTDPARRPFFGDTHVHTALSLDANLQGTRLTPTDAYRFARGEEVGIQPYATDGTALRTLRLARPLDFAVVSDHAEFLGTVRGCQTPDSPVYDHPSCQLYRDDPDGAFFGLNLNLALPQDDATYPPLCGDDGEDCVDSALTAWGEVTEAAEAAYDRTDGCGFTSFAGYEWSGNPGAYNLHRNVVFRTEVVPDLPVSYFDASTPEGLWEGLREGCIDLDDGCDALTIPHNSNLSGGLMFEAVDSDGEPFSAAYAAERAFMEPLVEVFQHKGSSECQVGTAAGDELCDFEALPFDSLSGANLDIPGDPRPIDFVRDALGRGLAYGADLGENPFRYGMIASTDTHLGTPGAVAEVGFPGHGGAGRSNRDELPEGLPDLVYFNPGGLAVLWAEENSREALFQAMRRREAYGTSGPRIVLRVFGGADLPADWCDDMDAEAGYASGVPMGGALAGGGTPRLAMAAWRDPGAADADGTPLQRLQVVKGWLDGDTVRYAVHDVAGDPDNGATVDEDTCIPSGGGFDQLCTVWDDPDFDPGAPAFYYVRVIENPTCRWAARQCADAAVDCSGPVDDAWAGCCDTRFPKTVQERAWSSPIWYAP